MSKDQNYFDEDGCEMQPAFTAKVVSIAAMLMVCWFTIELGIIIFNCLKGLNPLNVYPSEFYPMHERLVHAACYGVVEMFLLAGIYRKFRSHFTRGT